MTLLLAYMIFHCPRNAVAVRSSGRSTGVFASLGKLDFGAVQHGACPISERTFPGGKYEFVTADIQVHGT
jgi:hypothetical protein